MSITKLCISSVCAVLLSTTVNAQELFRPTVTPGAAGDGSDTQAYIGLAWQLGANRSPGARVVFGVRSTEVKGDDVLGADLNAWINLTSGLDRIAISGLAGSRTVQANAGFGYDFAGQQPIVTAAIQAPGVRFGVDFGLQKRKFVPYFELNALAKPKASLASADVLSCSEPGYVLVTRDVLTPFGQDLFDFIDSNGLDVDGRACLDPGFIA